MLPVLSIKIEKKSTQNAGIRERPPQVTASQKRLLNNDILPAVNPKANARSPGTPTSNRQGFVSPTRKISPPSRGQIANATAKKRHIKAVAIIRAPPNIGMTVFTCTTLLEDMSRLDLYGAVALISVPLDSFNLNLQSCIVTFFSNLRVLPPPFSKRQMVAAF